MKRSELKRKTPLRRTQMNRAKRTSSGPKTPKQRSKGSPNNFPEESRMAMRFRSGGACEVQSKVCTGEAQVFHHRQSRARKDQRPVNGLHACDACHKHIHAEVGKARLMGWIVPSWFDPADVPVKRGANA